MAIPITCDQTTLSVDLTDWAAQVTSSVRANLDATPIEADLTANAISSVTNSIKADPPTVNLSSAAIESIIATGVIGVAVPDQPVSLTNNLSVNQGETISQTVTLLQSDNETPLDLSGLTLELVFSTKDGDFIDVIENSNITVSGDNSNIVTFTYPSSLTDFVGQYIWSLREATAENKLRVKGYVSVLRAATNIS
jgi:hypothetical protein